MCRWILYNPLQQNWPQLVRVQIRVVRTFGFCKDYTQLSLRNITSAHTMAYGQRLRACLAYESRSSGLISGMGCLQKQNELNSGKLNAELCSLLSNGNTCSTSSLSLLYLYRNDNIHVCTHKYTWPSRTQNTIELLGKLWKSFWANIQQKNKMLIPLTPSLLFNNLP